MISIDNYDFKGKRAIIRVDFNVPLNEKGEVTDDTRIRAAIPTIKKVLAEGGSVILMSHMGRPKKNPDPKYSLEQIVPAVEKNLGTKVEFAGDCIGEKAAEMAKNLKPGQVMLLENLRFYAEEEGKPRGLAEDASKEEKDAAKKALKEGPQKEFVQKLASYADCYINDAFGTAHRAHASTEGVTHFAEKSAMGFLIERELEYLEGKLENPEKPFVVIMGGAKVSDKIEVLSKLMEKADTFLIGGAMANTFLAAEGYDLGASKIEGDKLDLAREILAAAKAKGVKFLLPADVRVAMKFEDGAETFCTAPFAEGGKVPEGGMAIDIGDKAIEEFSAIIKDAKTVLWNGPMGVFEMDCFAKGTKEVAEALADSSAISIVGGGDSVTAAKKFKVQDKLSFCSTGGGASLELLEGKVLPGVGALTDKCCCGK